MGKRLTDEEIRARAAAPDAMTTVGEALDAWRALSVVQRESVLYLLGYEAIRDVYPPLPAFDAAYSLLRLLSGGAPEEDTKP